MAAGGTKWAIEEYITEHGENLVLTFLAGLTGEDRADAIALLKLLAEQGNALRLPRSRALGNGLFELRGQQVRIFYMFRSGRRIILLDGMIKKRDSIPTSVLQRVRRYQRPIEAIDAETERRL